MQRLGLNVVRLGVLWSGVEPTRGHYNETYLDQLDTIVTLAATHGVYTLLDWHQDGISEHFCGEGAPSWAIRRAEQPQLRYPFPFAPAFNDSSLFYVEEKMGGAPTLPTRSACLTSHGPGWGETTRETAQAYQAIYSNWQGVADAFAMAQAKLASRFVRRPEVLGIELLNEPFAGALIGR
jgi:endoglycosylceramidase